MERPQSKERDLNKVKGHAESRLDLRIVYQFSHSINPLFGIDFFPLKASSDP